jgi:hypothetical protein
MEFDRASGFSDYEVVELPGGGWGVVIRATGALPRTETGFETRAEAEAWMFQAMERPTGPEGLPSHV